MSFFSKLREALRSKTGNERDEFCAHLQSLGIDAQMAPRGRAEEKIYTGPRQSLGVIDIAKGPIHWVNVTFATSYSGPDDDVDQPHPLVYGVPDPKVRSEFPEVRLHAKSFGKDPARRWWQYNVGTEVRWEGEDFGLGIAKHLSQNVLVTRAFLESLGYSWPANSDFEIQAYPDRCCWIMTVEYALTPSRQEWDCYQSIASHLLGTPMPPNT